MAIGALQTGYTTLYGKVAGLGTQNGHDCFDVGICRIAQLDLKEKTDLFFVTPFSILGLLLPSFFPQFSFKFGVILENNRSSKKQRLRIY